MQRLLFIFVLLSPSFLLISSEILVPVPSSSSIANKISLSKSTSPSSSSSIISGKNVSVSRAHYYLFPDKLEPTPTTVEWYTSSSAQTGGWAAASSTTDYGWNTISPTAAGWPASSTTDYGGWATPTPSPAPAPPPPPPPPQDNGWSPPAPTPPPYNGWATPAPPFPPPPPPPTNPGWGPPPPPPPTTPAPSYSGWGPPPTTTAPPPPTPGWMAPGGCTTAGCVYLENYIVQNILNSSTYYKQLRPPPYDNPTLVSVDVFIKNILLIDDTAKLWKAQLTLRQQWNDPRLAYNIQGCNTYKYFTLTSTDSIWTPDLFFPLEEEASYHDVPQRNILVWIAPNGDVTYSTRITLTMNCRGKKTDTQLVCPLIIGSYAYSSDKMRLQWLQPDPVQIDLDRIDLPNYTVGKVATSGNGDPTTYLGQFPGVVAKFTFAKKMPMCRYG